MTGPSPPHRGRSLTAWSLAALGAGLTLGALGHALGGGVFRWISAVAGPLGGLWITALQATVLPLVVTYLLAAVVGARGHESVGALGGRAVLLFVAMLVAAGLFTLAAAPALIALYPVDAAMLASLKATVVVPEATRTAAAAAAGGGSPGEWVSGLLPRNLFRAAADGEILPLLVFTALFGVAVARLPAEQREPLARVFQGLSAAMLTVVRWVLRFTPIGVFAFTYALALDSGGRAAGLLGAFVVIQSGLMLLATALLYPVSAVGGRVGVRDFARAVAPAQVVAVSTRSSVASLPALLDGARERLRLPPVATGFVLPLANSLFRINRTVSSTAKLLFLAHVYGLPLGAGTIAGFLATVILLSFGDVGVPGGGTAFKTLPAYLAAGVPIEAIIILESVEAVPDVFKTLLNVTGQMSAATLLSRSSRTEPAPAREEAPVLAGEPA